MRLSQIATRVLDAYDLSRADARQEARAGQLWAASRTQIAVAPTAEAAAWMLAAERVEPVECSTLPEQEIVRLGRLASSRARGTRFRRTGRLEVELARGGIGVPMILGESAWQAGDNARPSMQGFDDAIDALRYATVQLAQGNDDTHSSWPATSPRTQEFVRELIDQGYTTIQHVTRPLAPDVILTTRGPDDKP